LENSIVVLLGEKLKCLGIAWKMIPFFAHMFFVLEARRENITTD